MFRLELVYNVETSFAADYLVVRTNLLDTSTYFHTDHAPFGVHNTLLKVLILSAICDSALTKIVRSQFYSNAVARNDPDKMLSHLACNMCQY